MSLLILVRHGKSMWNELNLFTGWVDVPLNEQGINEALAAGKLIQDIPIDLVYTSELIRAKMTALLALSQHRLGKVPIMQPTRHDHPAAWHEIYSTAARENMIPVLSAWQLNERMYGELQGLNKTETEQKYGAEQVKLWRRSYDVAPPQGESLEMTAARAIPYFQEQILPLLKARKNVFIAAHGNSLRAIIMHLENLSREEVLHLELATGSPMCYRYQAEKFYRHHLI